MRRVLPRRMTRRTRPCFLLGLHLEQYCCVFCLQLVGCHRTLASAPSGKTYRRSSSTPLPPLRRYHSLRQISLWWEVQSLVGSHFVVSILVIPWVTVSFSCLAWLIPLEFVEPVLKSFLTASS
ncbi:hypothetical protein BDV19DRAFT_80970 [Aspergillus venezuelensis]